ncbi:MAG: hypothetical protein HY343_09570 [Lentisphaerae bacterium]|nr:hypothetical protein [Lentisphaerota bacterium]
MAYLPSLEEIVRELTQAGDFPPVRDIERLAAQADDESRVLGVLLQACEHFRNGREQEAYESLVESRRRFGCLPLGIMANAIWLALRLGLEQRTAYECLEFARYAAGAQAFDLALEACFAGLILDQNARFEILQSPEKSAEIARLYEAVAKACPAGGPAIKSDFLISQENFHGGRRASVAENTASQSKIQNPKSKIRVALVAPNLVDAVVAYTRRILYFARYFDRARFFLHVYSTENLVSRRAPLFPYGSISGSSESRGEQTIRELKTLNVGVTLAPADARFTEAARDLAGRLSADGMDAAIFQGGITCPVDWLVARWARVPVKLAIHNGSSMMVPGMDVTFFDNPVNIERENDVWPADAGARQVLCKGTDIEELNRQPAWPRARFGIPPDAVIIGVLSNHLDKRLTEPYMNVIAGVLEANPSAWFLALGSETIREKLEFFMLRGVGARVRFGGPQPAPGAGLKVLDMYANEFPVGGSQSVIEAMACGVPVAALTWSRAHAESVGAGLVGDEFAVPERDTDRYAALLTRWVRDADARRAAGRAAKQRAEQRFSAPPYVAAVLDKAEALFLEKATTHHELHG